MVFPPLALGPGQYYEATAPRGQAWMHGSYNSEGREPPLTQGPEVPQPSPAPTISRPSLSSGQLVAHAEGKLKPTSATGRQEGRPLGSAWDITKRRREWSDSSAQPGLPEGPSTRDGALSWGDTHVGLTQRVSTTNTERPTLQRGHQEAWCCVRATHTAKTALLSPRLTPDASATQRYRQRALTSS